MAPQKPRISRRTMLRGMLGGAAVAVGLPTLDIFLNENGNAYADGSALPRRFGIFYWGNGVIPHRFTPVGEGTDWELSEELMPLAPVKDLITVVSGMQVKTGNEIAHESGVSGILAGAGLHVEGESWRYQGPTIDQVVAAEIGMDKAFPSFEVSVQPNGSGRSMVGPGNQNYGRKDPRTAFEELFGGSFRLPGAEPIIDPTLSLRRSVLDAVGDQSRQLAARVGRADRARLQAHFESIRQLERRLAALEADPPNLAACDYPPMPEAEYPDIDGRPQLSARSRAFSEILTMAAACDTTRVFTQWFSDPVSNLLYPGHAEGHHRLTHDEPGEQEEVHDIVVQIMEELSYFIQRLASVEEGDGTLLDNCAVLCTSDVSFGRQHKLEDFPIIIAGGACGQLRQGYHYASTSNENTSKVGLTLIRAMGINAESFGLEEGYVTDSLGAIES